MKILIAVGAVIISVLILQSLRLQEASAEPSVRVEFVADQTAGIARIVIDGKEVARFTAEGLDVPGDVRFGGVMSDTVPGTGR